MYEYINKFGEKLNHTLKVYYWIVTDLDVPVSKFHIKFYTFGKEDNLKRLCKATIEGDFIESELMSSPELVYLDLEHFFREEEVWKEQYKDLKTN